MLFRPLVHDKVLKVKVIRQLSFWKARLVQGVICKSECSDYNMNAVCPKNSIIVDS